MPGGAEAPPNFGPFIFEGYTVGLKIFMLKIFCIEVFMVLNFHGLFNLRIFGTVDGYSMNDHLVRS